ncbi:MAG TPA: hypothetical protein VIF86_07700 [Methylobacter sp.]
MSLKKRLKFLEQIVAKLPPLALQCDYSPSPNQIAEINRAESLGRHVILFMLLPSTVWISGAPKPWEAAQCD